MAAAAWADYGPSFYGPPVNDGNWHLVELGFVPATNTFTLYVDGAAASSYTPGTTFTESTASFYIGHRVPAGADDFLGQIANVSVTHGTADALTGDTWYNPLNRVVKQAPEGAAKMYTKTVYDLANRVIGTYTGYAPTSDTNNFAVNSSDKIFEQTVLTLDAAGNTQLATFFQRNQGDTTVDGALTSSHARVSYMAFWQDGGERPIATANYGAAATAPTVPLPLPVSGPTVLVNGTAYNNRSEAYLFNDPSGMVVRTDTDDAGRPVRTIQNYVPGACSTAFMRNAAEIPAEAGTTSAGWGPAAWSAAPATTGPDVNVTTLTAYTRDDNVAKLTAVNPATGNQQTKYLYGTTLATSAVARNDLLAAVLYPDAADSADSVQLLYNLQSEVSQMQDQNGSVHQYFRDLMGRVTSDQVPTLRHECQRHGGADRHGVRDSRHGHALDKLRRCGRDYHRQPGFVGLRRIRAADGRNARQFGHRRPGQRRRLWLQQGRHVQFDRAAFADLPGRREAALRIHGDGRHSLGPRDLAFPRRGYGGVLRLLRPGQLRLRHLRDLAGDQHHAGDQRGQVIPVSTSSAA